MQKKEFKEELFNLLSNNIDDITYIDKINLIYDILIEFEKKNENLRNLSNKGKSWTDEELKIILMDAPTKSNCLKYAKLFNRGYGSIEQIYRWATTPNKKMSEERKEDSFINQIKKVAKEIGFRG
jgi:uncharacterized protein PM1205